MQDPLLDRLDDATHMALFRARAQLFEHGGKTISDAHLLMGLLNADPGLAPLLSMKLQVQRLSECLMTSVVSEVMLTPGVEVPMDPAVKAILSRAVKLAGDPPAKVSPTHVVLAMIQEPHGKAVGCLKEAAVDLNVATGRLTRAIAGQ